MAKRKYWDANILNAGKKFKVRTVRLVEEARKLGYDTILLNTQVQESNRNEHQNCFRLDPKSHLGINVLYRVTLTIDVRYPTLLTRKGCNLVSTHDVLAVCPMSAQMFEHACKTLDIDIISLPTERLNYKINIPNVRFALKRGIIFELLYSPGLEDTARRRAFFSTGSNMVLATNSKQIILSSGADRPFFLRSPLDVRALGAPLGLREEKAMDALSKNLHGLLTNRVLIRDKPPIVSKKRVAELTDREKWKVPKFLGPVPLKTVLKDLDMKEDVGVDGDSEEMIASSEVPDVL